MKKVLLIVILLCGLGGGLYVSLRSLFALPQGPVEVLWDKEPCAHCRMHVGEPHFAAQLQTTDREVLNFDDPGCLLAFQAKQRRPVHAIYFHHLKENRWIPQSEVFFIPVEPSPMGYNLGAVSQGTPNAVSLQQAEALVLSLGARR